MTRAIDEGRRGGLDASWMPRDTMCRTVKQSIRVAEERRGCGDTWWFKVGPGTTADVLGRMYPFLAAE